MLGQSNEFLFFGPMQRGNDDRSKTANPKTQDKNGSGRRRPSRGVPCSAKYSIPLTSLRFLCERA
jgi:hypothetical protein